jgi:hypothetical protein
MRWKTRGIATHNMQRDGSQEGVEHRGGSRGGLRLGKQIAIIGIGGGVGIGSGFGVLRRS